MAVSDCIRTCRYCGTQFQRTAKGQPTKYCGAQCRDIAKGRRGLNPHTHQQGGPCGQPQCDRPAYSRGLCCLHYQRRRCGRRVDAPAIPKGTRVARTCRGCGVVMNLIPSAKRTLCSRECRALVRRAVGFDPQIEYRRRRRAAISQGDAIDPIAVFRRDRWRCHLCGTHTPRRLRGTLEASAPELDHIVPLAMGGTHTWGNVACACRQCNSRKGAKPIGQLLLDITADHTVSP